MKVHLLLLTTFLLFRSHSSVASGFRRVPTQQYRPGPEDAKQSEAFGVCYGTLYSKRSKTVPLESMERKVALSDVISAMIT